MDRVTFNRAKEIIEEIDKITESLQIIAEYDPDLYEYRLITVADGEVHGSVDIDINLLVFIQNTMMERRELLKKKLERL